MTRAVPLPGLSHLLVSHLGRLVSSCVAVMAPADPAAPAPVPPPSGGGVAGAVGGAMGNVVASAMSSALDSMMRSVWSGCLDVLQAVFGLVDHFSTFTFTTGSQASPSGPPAAGTSVIDLGSVWPTLLWLSGVIAFALFLWQLTLAAVRGGRGMWHAATGPLAYGIALAVTVAAVTSVLALGDGLTSVILTSGLKAGNFAATWTHLPFSAAQAMDGVKAVVLGLAGLFGLLPVALGYAIEIIWRQAAILLLVATIPVSAAGLLAQSTASWYWRTLRWTLAAIAMKPLLALTVVLGVASLAGQSGLVGLLAGIGVLAVSLLCPFALFRLFAFVDPATQAGSGLREAFSGIASRAQAGMSGFGDSASWLSADSRAGKGGGDSGGVGAMEAANTSRFDSAGGRPAGGSDTTPAPGGSGGELDGAQNPVGDATAPLPSTRTSTATLSRPGDRSLSSGGGDPDAGAAGPTTGPDVGGAGGGSGAAVADSSRPGEDPPPPEPPPTDPGPPGGGGPPRPPSGGHGPRGGPGGGSGGASAAEVEEAAVIL